MLTEVAEDLVRAGYAVECITAQPGYAGVFSAPKEEILRGIHVRRLGRTPTDRHRFVGRLVGDLGYVLRAGWYIARADHTATLLISTSPPYLGLLGLAAKLCFSQRYVYVVHDIYPDLARRMGVLRRDSIVAACWRWLEKQALRHASAIIVQGRDMQQVLQKRLPARLRHHVQVIPLGADHHRVHPLETNNGGFRRTWCHNGEMVALYAGNMGRCHDMETIIEAAALLQGKPIRIVLSGGGVKRKQLEALTKARRLTNVIFHDYVPANRLNELLAACDVGLVTVDKSAEGLLVPCKLYNLMAAGKPVMAVSSDESETGRTITSAACGVLIEQGHAAELASCLSAMARDRTRCLAMGAAGRRYLVANLSRQHRARQFVRVFREVRGER